MEADKSAARSIGPMRTTQKRVLLTSKKKTRSRTRLFCGTFPWNSWPLETRPFLCLLPLLLLLLLLLLLR